MAVAPQRTNFITRKRTIIFDVTKSTNKPIKHYRLAGHLRTAGLEYTGPKY